jgi:hypothetical protein
VLAVLLFMQLTTRTFSYGGTEVLIPIIDMANHDNACQHTHRVEPCDPAAGLKQRRRGSASPDIPPSFAKGVNGSVNGSMPVAKKCGMFSWGCKQGVSRPGLSGVCITWRAETPLVKGWEVCNNYGLLLQDHALLQYGFLQVSIGGGSFFLVAAGGWLGLQHMGVTVSWGAYVYRAKGNLNSPCTKLVLD